MHVGRRVEHREVCRETRREPPDVFSAGSAQSIDTTTGVRGYWAHNCLMALSIKVPYTTDVGGYATPLLFTTTYQ